MDESLLGSGPAPKSPSRRSGWRGKAADASPSQYESFDTVLASHGIHTSVGSKKTKGKSLLPHLCAVPAAGHVLYGAAFLPPLMLTELLNDHFPR